MKKDSVSSDMLLDEVNALQTYLDIAGVIIVVLDRNGNIALINKKGCEVLGYDKKEILGKDWFKTAIPKKIRDEIRSVFSMNMEGIAPIGHYENTVVTKKKEERIISWHNSILKKDGKIIGTVSSGEDITEKHRMHIALLHADDEWARTFDAIPTPISINDKDFNIVKVNKAYADMFRDVPQRIIGKKCHVICHNIKSPCNNCPLKRAIKTNKPESEEFFEPFLKKYLKITVSPITNPSGEITNFVHVIQDLTEHVAANERIKENEEQYRMLFNSANDAIFLNIWEGKAPGKFIEINDIATRILGYSREEFLNISPGDIYAEEVKNSEAINQAFAKDGHALFERQLKAKNGKIVLFEINAHLFKAKGKNYVLSIARDIEEKRSIEEELLHNYELEEAIIGLLKVSIQNMPVETILKEALDRILAIKWIALESKGAIFLTDENHPDSLVLTYQRGLNPYLLDACAHVKFGKCLCGKAALTKKTVFAAALGHDHETTYQGIVPHGHFCVPILSAGKVLGVINTYIKSGHEYSKKEEDFLTAIADTLAGVLERKRSEDALKKSKQELEKRISELEKFHMLTVDRELRISELKKRVAELEKEKAR